ncbi:MAG: NADH-quinone oxidoreductase subunit C [Deltaproteobacteria bacterium]|nr:NADH-quinone oxidoreductase subunit C [Deltaproteobacteria bacterium]
MNESHTLTKLLERFQDQILYHSFLLGQEAVTLRKEGLVPICRFLREDPQLQYDRLSDITAVDYLQMNPSPLTLSPLGRGEGEGKLRFEVVYHLHSVPQGYWVRLKVPLSEEDLTIDSLVPLWKGANWLEREVWDMFGVKFIGHPNLRRILMYPEFEGHPLRKDYPVDKRQPLIPLRRPENFVPLERVARPKR